MWFRRLNLSIVHWLTHHSDDSRSNDADEYSAGTTDASDEDDEEFADTGSMNASDGDDNELAGIESMDTGEGEEGDEINDFEDYCGMDSMYPGCSDCDDEEEMEPVKFRSPRRHMRTENW